MYIHIHTGAIFIRIEARSCIPINDFCPNVYMSPVSIHTQAFVCYCSPIQGRMAGATTGSYEFDSVI